MKLPRFTLRRVVVSGILLLLAAGLVAPYLHADRFGERIREALENSLGLTVEFGEVRFNLFRGPGFSVRRVVIHDDPAIGIEPLAYVASVETRIRLRSLWTGRLEFSSLRLVEPSVNLVKTPAGPWNFQPLLNRAAGANLPEIRVRGGRLNFKFGDVKSVFYFGRADVDITPPWTPGGTFDLRFSGEPGRTDRAAHGFGRLSGGGRWRPSRDAGGHLELDLSLARSAIAELTTLVHGQDIGLHGLVAARARLRGPVSNLEITGNLELQDIHRWDLMPPYAAGGPLEYRGQLDLLSQHLELETVAAKNSPLAVRFRASDYLTAPSWAVSVTLNELPLSPLLDVVRHTGLSVAESTKADGRMTGVVGYSPESGFQGKASLRDTLVSIFQTPPVRIEEAQLVLNGDRLRLSPALLRTATGETAHVEVDYLLRTRRLDLKITTGSLSLAKSSSERAVLLGAARLPILEQLRGGAWQGWMRYRREGDDEGDWSGAIEILDTRVSLPGVANPLEIQAAKLALAGDVLTMRGVHARLGEAEIEGEYEYRPRDRRPHRLHCRAAQLSAAELERLLMPSLRPPQGLLSRALPFRRVSPPGWLLARHAEGRLEVGSLSLAGFQLESVRARWFWDGTALEVTEFAGRVENGRVTGHLSVDLRAGTPAYELGGRIQAMHWKGGRLDGEGAISTSGVGADLYLNLRADGSFRGRSIAPTPEAQFRSVSGCWGLSWTRKQPRLRLTCLRLVQGQGVFIGQGVTQDDGRLRIDVSSGEEEMRLVGSLAPFAIEVVRLR